MHRGVHGLQVNPYCIMGTCGAMELHGGAPGGGRSNPSPTSPHRTFILDDETPWAGSSFHSFPHTSSPCTPSGRWHWNRMGCCGAVTLGVGRRHWGARRHQGDPGDTREVKPQPIGTTRGVAKQRRWVRLRTSMDGDSATGDSMGGGRPWVEDVHGCKVYYGERISTTA